MHFVFVNNVPFILFLFLLCVLLYLPLLSLKKNTHTHANAHTYTHSLTLNKDKRTLNTICTHRIFTNTSLYFISFFCVQLFPIISFWSFCSYPPPLSVPPHYLVIAARKSVTLVNWFVICTVLNDITWQCKKDNIGVQYLYLYLAILKYTER